jgi:carbonic anhydrase
LTDNRGEKEPARTVDRTDEFARLLAENDRYTEAFDRSPLTAAPLTGLVIVACMDSRLVIEEARGLRTGDAHIIRNAGGLVTDDVIRSLVVSTELLGTDEIVIIEHTGCGLHGANEMAIRERVAANSGLPMNDISMTFGAFSDLAENVARQVDILRTHPFLRRIPVHGLVFDVANGRLHEIG